MTENSNKARREDFTFWYDMATRWNDNDQLGHVNNVVYNSFFEACVVNFVQNECKNDWFHSPSIPYAAETSCRFIRPVAFPAHLDVGLRIAHVGRTSVKYSLALFVEGEEEASATSDWVHVWVDRKSERPTPIPESALKAYTRHRQ